MAQISKKAAINIIAGVTASALVGVSILCIVNDQKSDNSQTTHHADQISIQEYKDQSGEDTLLPNASTFDSSDENSLLASVSTTTASSTDHGTVSVDPSTMVMNIVPKSITIATESKVYSQALNAAASQAKIDVNENETNINEKVQNAKFSLNMDKNLFKPTDKIAAIITNASTEKDAQGNTTKVKAFVTFNWVSGDVLLASSSGHLISISA